MAPNRRSMWQYQLSLKPSLPKVLMCNLLYRLGGKKIALQGGDGTEAHFSNPPVPFLGRRAGTGVWAGAALPAVRGGGGGSDPNIHGSK